MNVFGARRLIEELKRGRGAQIGRRRPGAKDPDDLLVWGDFDGLQAVGSWEGAPLVDPVVDDGVSVWKTPGLLQVVEPVCGASVLGEKDHAVSPRRVTVADAQAVGDEDVAVIERRDAPETLGRKRPEFVAIGVVLDNLVEVHVSDEQGADRGEARVAELSVDADGDFGLEGELFFDGAGADVDDAKKCGGAVLNVEDAVVADGTAVWTSCPAGHVVVPDDLLVGVDLGQGELVGEEDVCRWRARTASLISPLPRGIVVGPDDLAADER